MSRKYLILSIIMLCLFPFTCSAGTMPSVTLLSHRGYTKYAPENTLPSFVHAAKAGYTLLETDVRESSDGEFFIMHDATVNRMTDGIGAVSALPAAEIRKLHVDAGNRVQGAVYRVPTLKQTLDVCRNYGIVPVLHCVGVESYDRFMELCRKYPFYNKIVYMGEYEPLVEIRKRNPSAKLMAVNWNTEPLRDTLERFADIKLTCLNVYQYHIKSEKDVDLVKKYGIRHCCAWFVNNTGKMAKYGAYGVEWYVTDDITADAVKKIDWTAYRERLEKEAGRAAEKKALASISGILDNMTVNSDLPGSRLLGLMLRETAADTDSVSLKWNPNSAAAYYVYGGQITKKPAKLGKTTEAAFRVGNLSPARYYRFVVFAVNKNGSIKDISKTIYAVPSGAGRCNCSRIANIPAGIRLKKNKTYKLTPVEKKEKSSAEIRNLVGMRFYSSNAAAAAVSFRTGVITAKSKGTAKIYAVAQNGKYVVTTVTVS